MYLSRWFTEKYYNTNLHGVIGKKFQKKVVHFLQNSHTTYNLKKMQIFTLYEHGEIPWDQGIHVSIVLGIPFVKNTPPFGKFLWLHHSIYCNSIFR